MQDIQKYPTVTSLQIQQADPGLEKEKKSIYSHPLYPLLSLLLEQCEQATSSPDSQSPDTFDADLQSYIQRHEGNDKMFFTDNNDLDSLIVKAIQVLRIHLNELRKVNELCRDFCTRYISCLKTKIHQDSMFDDSEESSPNGSERLSPTMMPGSGSAYNSPYSLHGSSMGRNYLDMGSNHRHQHMMGQLNNMGHSCNSAMSGISVDCVEYMNGTNTSPPLSGMSMHDDITNNNYLTSVASANSGAYNNLLDPSKQKRGVLPKKATQIMKQWLFQHLVHPYPTEDEKRQIANQTNLTLLQVNNWFINARRRILQPMLDSSGSPNKERNSHVNLKHEKSDSVSESEDTCSGLIYSSSCGNRKKKAATNRPSNNRFWPASLAAAVNILSTHQTMNNCIPSSPITTVASDRSTPKIISQVEAADNLRSRKRTKTNSSDVDVYQPPKIFSSTKESYESYISELDYKSHQKDAKSQSDTSTPQYTELSSPNNSKSNSMDDGDRIRPEPLNLPSTILPNNRNSSPKSLQDSNKPHKPDILSSYLSSSNNFNTISHDLPSVSLFPPNPCSYVSSNPYANIVIPQTNSYLNHPAMFYNASLQRAVQQNDSNSMSSALFNMRHPNPHSFPIYDSMYPNYEHLIDKRQNVASHINDLFTVPHGFSRSWEEQKAIKNFDNPPNVIKNEFTESVQESGSLNNHSYAHLEAFPNFKAFHSKTNSN
uniref:PREP-1 n=1 Tax=Dendrocoelum lacteum TaxID=27895 RepID=T1DF70_9PLAT